MAYEKLPENREQLAEAAQKSREKTLQDIDNKLNEAYSALKSLGDPHNLTRSELGTYRQIQRAIGELEKQRQGAEAAVKNPFTKQEKQKESSQSTTTAGSEGRREVTAQPITYAPGMEDNEADIKAGGLEMLRRSLINPQLVSVVSEEERWNKYADLVGSLRRFAEETKGLMDTLAPDMATAKEHAKGYIGQPQVSRGALDELQRRGPVQMDMPEAPSMWNAATQMLVGVIGQAFQNFNQSELSAAESQQVVTGAAESSAAYQAAEFASFKNNRQKVLEINAQLQAQYQNDLINAMRDYETRADAAQWNYEKQLLDAALNEQRQYYNLYGKLQEYETMAGKLRADVGMGFVKDKEAADRFNAQQKQGAAAHNARAFAEMQAVTMRMMQDQRQLRQQLALKQMQAYEQKLNNALKGGAPLGIYGSAITDRAKWFIANVELLPGTRNGDWNNKQVAAHTAGVSHFLQQARVKLAGMYKNDVARQRAFANLVNNISALADAGWVLRQQVSDATFNTLTSDTIDTAVLSANLNKSGLNQDEFATPENTGNAPESIIWRTLAAGGTQLALVNYLDETYRGTAAAAAQTQSSYPTPIPVEKD